MLNQLFTFKSVKEERPFLTFLGVCLVVIVLNVSVDPVSPQVSDATAEVSSSYENTTMVQSASLDMNDGDAEAVVMELNQNWSDDGWHVKSIEVVLSYEETAFADLDCDTVSGALSLTSNGQEPDTSTAEGASSDCSDIVLSMVWLDADEPDLSLLASMPATVQVDVELSVDSTVPGNDDEETVNVDIELQLTRLVQS